MLQKGDLLNKENLNAAFVSKIQDNTGMVSDISTSGSITAGSLTSNGNLDVAVNANISGNLIVDGNVGIGISNPAKKLDIAGTVNVTQHIIAPEGVYGAATGAPNATIWAISEEYTNWGIFYTQGTPGYIEFKSGGTTTSRISLDNGDAHFALNGGKVGIGTSNPSYTLDIIGSLRISSSNDNYTCIRVGNSGTGYSAIFFDASDGDFQGVDYAGIGQLDNLDLALYTNGLGGDITFSPGGWLQSNEVMRITKSGKVGIGTNNPESLFHISAGTSGSAKLILEADTDNNNEADQSIIELRQDGNIVKGFFGFRDTTNDLKVALTHGRDTTTGIRFLTGSDESSLTEKMVIKYDGKVGIGTSTPTDLLHINTNGDGIRLGDSASSYIHFSEVANGDGFSILFDGSGVGDDNKLHITGGVGSPNSQAKHVTITRGGDVGIGTTSPSEKLEVNGNIKINSGKLLSTGGFTTNNWSIEQDPTTNALEFIFEG